VTLQSITIRRPDDWHVHLRDGAMLDAVAPFTARQFARAIIMPNLAPPITAVAQAEAYRTRIRAAAGPGFTPLMTAYLTDDSAADEIERGHRGGVWVAAKLYPAGATTNSASGVTDIVNIARVLERMERIGMPLLVHGEVTDPAIDIFDREAVFIERVLLATLARFPALRIVFEHVTTRDAAELVTSGAFPNLAATITPQHLILNRNALFDGGLRPHAYCLPVVKREEHRLAVRRAAVSGSPNVFLGTDSAPHVVGAKEGSCGCAGLFNAPFAIEAYASVFDEENALDRLEAFASENGPRFYGLPLNEERITLERGGELVPPAIGDIVPFGAGGRFGWRLAG
jgi:dihydroorotase